MNGAEVRSLRRRIEALPTPRLLDLFCCAGGAARGYMDAGFHVVGVDISEQPRYCGHLFVRMDALEFLAAFGDLFDAVHASPPCKLHTGMMEIRKDCGEVRAGHSDLITPLRPLLIALARPYVIENVPGARGLLINPAMLCGAFFGLRVLRHRLFETNWPFRAPPHVAHVGTVAGGELMGVYGHGGPMWADKAKTRRRVGSRRTRDWRAAMGMDWASRDELTQAIPPAYTRYIGQQLRAHLIPLGITPYQTDR